MKRFLLIQSNEDGAPNTFLSDTDLDTLLNDPGYYGIDRFLTWDEVDKLGDDANYWPEHAGLLIEFTVKAVLPVATAWKLA